ncbi:MAG: hypothetical protein WC506_01935 [Candidatus Micrarchaeia archaeon]
MAEFRKGQIFSADFAIAAALFATALALFLSASQSHSALQAQASRNAALLDASMQAASAAAGLCSASGAFDGRFDAAAVQDFFTLSKTDYELARKKLGLLQGASNYDFSASLSVPSGLVGQAGMNPPASGSKSVFRRNGLYGNQSAILELEVWER